MTEKLGVWVIVGKVNAGQLHQMKLLISEYFLIHDDLWFRKFQIRYFDDYC